MSKDLEGTCATCQHRMKVSGDEMNIPQKNVYKGRVLRCGNSNSKYYRQLIRPEWACGQYKAKY